MTYRTLEAGVDRLKIAVLDEPGKGGPDHRHSNLYRVVNMDASTNPAWDGQNQHSVLLMLQNGPLSDGKPANGLTVDALLAIACDRLRSLRSTAALERCEAARAILKDTVAP